MYGHPKGRVALDAAERGTAMGLRQGDPRDLTQAGWGVIFAPDIGPEVKEALRPLLEHRKQQAGQRYRDLKYQRGETKRTFLARHGAGAGSADPRKMPYYLLIVGDPRSISFHFQSDLDLQYAVGRISFEAPDEYWNYACSVVQAETTIRELPPKQVSFFGVSNPDDASTQRLVRDLVEPLAATLTSDRTDWSVRKLLEQQATKAQLSRLLGGGERPALLFSAAHGIAFPADDPRQRREQGAILCQDWPGPVTWRAPLSREHYFTAEDVPADSRLLGLIVFLLNDFSGGTSELSSPEPPHFGEPTRIANFPFVSSLAERLLGHEGSGALALIGTLRRLWLIESQQETFEGVLKRLLDGHPIGSAMEYVSQRYADLSSDLSALISDQRAALPTSQPAVLRLWREVENYRALIVLGDPAVRLRPSEDQAAGAIDTTATIRTSGRVVSKAAATEDQTLREPAPDPLLGELAGAVSDRVADEDQLGFRFYLWALADLIESTDTQPPITIGILGSWGMGKSFLLQHLPRILSERAKGRTLPHALAPARKASKVISVSFNAWEYSASEAIWPALARKIVDSLEKEVRWNIFRRLVARLRRNFKSQVSRDRGWIFPGGITLILVLTILLWTSSMNLTEALAAALVLGGGVGVLKILIETLKSSFGQWIADLFQDQSYGRPMNLIDMIHADLGLLEEKLRGIGGRVLILIDDLDRCEPGKAVEMLQAINLLLDFESFIVCLGIDARLITRAVEKHYENLLGEAGASGYEYLDKIIQIPFRIPPPSPRDVELFIARLMGDPMPPLPVPAPAEGASPGQVSEPPQMQSEPEASLGGTAPAATSVGISISEAAPATPAFTYDEFLAFQRLSQILRPNPRHIKRLVNVYRLVRSLARYKQERTILVNPEATVLWIAICSQWPITAHLMTEEYQKILRNNEGRTAGLPQQKPLIQLWEKVEAQTSLQGPRGLGEDPTRLREFLERGDAHMSWEALEVIQRYTINFNPAIELETLTKQPAKPVEAQEA